MKTPLYSGETPAISRVPQAQLPSTHPMQRTWDANTARATENAYALENALVDRLEYTRQQELEAAETQLNADIKADLDTTLQLANGAPGSLFDKDGKPNKAAIQSFTSRYTARLADFDKGFITPQSRQTAALAKASLTTGIGNTIRATVAASLKPRATAAFKVNYELAIKQGLTQKAHNAAKSLLEAGFCTPEEYTLYCMDADEKGIDYQLDHIQSFEQGDALYNNPGFTDKLNAQQLRKLESRLKYLGAQGIPSAVILKRGRKPGSTNPADYEKTTPLPPAGIPYYMQSLWATHSGNFKTENPNGRQTAAVAAFRWAIDTIPTDNPDSPEWEAMFRTQAAAFGISESTASAAIKEARAQLTANTAPSVTEAINAIPDHALLFPMPDNYTDFAITNNLIGVSKYADLNDKDYKEATTKDAFHHFLNTRVSQEEAKSFSESGLSPEAWMKARAKYFRDSIQQQYSTWLSNGSNQRASFEQKLQQLNHIINQTATSAHRFKHIGQQAMEPFINAARQAELEAQIRTKNIRAQQIKTRSLTEEYQKQTTRKQAATPEFHPLSYSAADSAALPYSASAPVIYVPKGYSKLGEPGNDAALIHPHTGSTMGVRIMESDQVTQPTLSIVLNRQLGLYLNRNKPKLNISLHRGALFITDSSIGESVPPPPQSEISPDNQLFPDDGLVPPYEYTDEEAMPISDLPLA